MALHTWGQKMNLHVHIHVIMTAGGLSIKRKGRKRNEATPCDEEERWVSFEQHDEALGREKLACEFRKRFLRGLKRLYAKGNCNFHARWSSPMSILQRRLKNGLGPLSAKCGWSTCRKRLITKLDRATYCATLPSILLGLPSEMLGF